MKNFPRLDVNKYVGKAYRKGAAGPDDFDCWGLVHFLYRRYLNLELPDYDRGASDKESMRVMNAVKARTPECRVLQSWERPQDWDIVFREGRGLAHHAGLFMCRGVLHSSETVGGVRFDRVTDFGPCRFYRWNIQDG